MKDNKKRETKESLKASSLIAFEYESLTFALSSSSGLIEWVSETHWLDGKGNLTLPLLVPCNLILVHANTLNRGGVSPIERVDWLNLDLCVDGFQRDILSEDQHRLGTIEHGSLKFIQTDA